MKAVPLSAAVVAALGLAACEPPLWPASHGELHSHVEAETARSQAADAQLHEEAQSALARANQAQASANAAAASAQHPFAYSIMMTDDSIVFPTNKADLSPEAQARLQEIVDKLKAENRNLYIEVQGHGDEHGSAARNLQLGEQRAEAVRRFMAGQGVPLPRIATISYGKEKPKVQGSAPEADAQNRRAVIVVMNGGPG